MVLSSIGFTISNSNLSNAKDSYCDNVQIETTAELNEYIRFCLEK